jgi:predicted transcriptional regulator
MIIAQMLRTINESDAKGATRTLIMHKSLLSYTQLKEYLSFLIEKGLMSSLRNLRLVVMKN